MPGSTCVLLAVLCLCGASVAVYGAQEDDAARSYLKDGRSSARSRKPEDVKNVLVLLADDEGFEMPVYGNNKIKTPHLDDLAKRSLTFTNAFTSVSSCSPSRSAVLTGLPQHQNGMYGLHNTYYHYNSFDAVRSLPRLLNSSGEYWTGIIGKKHVGPDYVYPFPFAFTEENDNILQVSRNITYMKNLAHDFLSRAKGRPFFLYVAFMDPHRCNIPVGKNGEFCQNFGDGSPGMGKIQDWTPTNYTADDVYVPPFLPDTTETRIDLTYQYRSISRLDQGVGLMLDALKQFGYDDNTLIIYTSDNGIPFPNAKTNLYDPGMGEPMFVSSPLARQRWGQKSEALVSHLDIVPTILDWFGLTYPKYNIYGPNPVTLTGTSLLPVLEKEPTTGFDTVFASHNLHEPTMYYPMRVIRNKQMKLIHNLNYGMPKEVALDVFLSPSFQDILNRTQADRETGWFKTLQDLYYRAEWELYNISSDPMEVRNLAYSSSHKDLFSELQQRLHAWQLQTNDPWLCAPMGKLGADGKTCLTEDNHTEL